MALFGMFRKSGRTAEDADRRAGEQFHGSTGNLVPGSRPGYHKPYMDPNFLRKPTSEPDGDEPYRMLFVCTGNICRSMAAAAICRHFMNVGDSELPSVAKGWLIESAGTGAVVGSGPDQDMNTALVEIGIVEGEAHVAKQVQFQLLNAADVVVVFDKSHYRWISNEVPGVIAKMVPLGKMADLLENHGAMSLAELMAMSNSVAIKPEHWIEDPYRLGLDAARTCVSEIKRDLDIVIANLK